MRALARSPSSDATLLVDRYLPLVYASALRRTGDAAQAALVSQAVFLVLARRARRLRRHIVLPAWLFQVTAVACRKLKRSRRTSWNWLRRKPAAPPQIDPSMWAELAPRLDRALDRLSRKHRDIILLRTFLGLDASTTAKILRVREPRAEKLLAGGLKKLVKRLGRRDAVAAPETFTALCARESCTAAFPDSLASCIALGMEQAREQRLSLDLARRTLRSLAWARWRRRCVIGIPIFALVLVTLAGLAWHIDGRTGHSRLLSAFLVWSVRNEARRVPGLAQPARPWPAEASVPTLEASSARRAEDVYRITNIWLAHLSFSADQWQALQPRRVGVLPNFLQPDGTALLRNPEAQRSGLAGVLGYDFNWTRAEFAFGGSLFTNVAVRLKGNGTWLGSLSGDKRPFKVDLNRNVKGQKLAGLDEFNFNNLVADASFMSDALAYEFFREAGVPAPRTAYAWLTVSVAEKWERKPLGLYALVEPVDELFASTHLRSRKAPIFKPVTYRLFEFLGEEWSAYEAVYDLKTQATAVQQQRVIEFARLVSSASDELFAARVGDYLDLDAFARFLAVNVLLSCYDSILANGQNFYVYLDPRSNKFGFIPWDLDLAWGGFFLLGTTRERERASIWHPWVGENRFIERVMAVEEFQGIYRAHLESFLTNLFVPARLHERIDAMATLLGSPIAAESDFRFHKFEQAVGLKPLQTTPDANPHGADRPAHRLKHFINQRSTSVRQQLDGDSKGIILNRGGRPR